MFDATPGAFGAHTANRGAGTGICDRYLDETAVKDEGRNLLADFEAAGWYYAPDLTTLEAMPAGTGKLLGLFNLSNMNVALDKIEGRRNPAAPNTVVAQVGLPDQPMLDEMAAKALQVLNQNPNGFVLMVEAASIDKQAHNMDTERWILDTIEMDRAIAVCRQFADQNPDTLVLVTADHECAGVNIIGPSRVTDAALQTRIAKGLGATEVRNGVVGTYELAGFPKYEIAADGYPMTTDVDSSAPCRRCSAAPTSNQASRPTP